MGVRISEAQRRGLEKIAKTQSNTVSGVIRLAIDQMIQRYSGAFRTRGKEQKSAKKPAALPAPGK